MSNPAISSDLRRYEVKAKLGDGPSSPTVMTDLRIEAAGTIMLTQSEGDDETPGLIYVPPTTNLTVLGDVVIFEGPLKFPGRIVKIVARRIEARWADKWKADPSNVREYAPAIIVDGPDLDPEIGHPKQLPRGVTPKRLAPLQKVTKGRKGDDATNNTVFPTAHPGDNSLTGVVFGQAGWSAKDHPREMHGEPGENGVPGNPGGSIVLVCKDLAVTSFDFTYLDTHSVPNADVLRIVANVLTLSAGGGRGGDGQPGQDGADGGDGGEPFDARSGAGFAGLGYKFSVPGGEGGKGGDGGRGGNAGPGGNGGSIFVYTEAPTTQFTNLKKPGSVLARPFVGARGDPGKGGARGEGGKGARAATGLKWPPVPGQDKRRDGDPGVKGADGGNPDKDGLQGTVEFADAEKASAAFLRAISVAQLAMMTDRVRAAYLGLGPEADDKARSDVLERMEWLSGLLKNIAPEHPHYPIARAVVLEVLDAKNAIKLGLDWFGNGPGYVPSVSVGKLSEDVTRQLEVLKALEELNDKYVQALIHQQETTAVTQRALSVGNDQLAAVAAEFATIHGKLDEAADAIEKADNDRKNAREPLEKALVGFNENVVGTFGLSAETLFNAMSQLSFTSPENPAGAGLMVASQVGTILNEGMKNILDDTGRPVNKSYVLGEVNRLSSPELSVDLAQLADGSFAEEPTYRVLVEYDKVKQLIKNFATTTGAQAAIDQINKFIDLVVERNRHVNHYNSLLRDLIALNAQERRLKLRQQISRDSLSRSNPSLDQVTDFISALYESAKQDCLKALYLLYRAQSFWSLQPLNGFNSLLGASPIGVRYAQLFAAAGRASTMLRDSLERIRRTPNSFPNKDRAVGVPIVLTREKHKFIFDDLELLGWAHFRIAPATRLSPTTTMWEPTAAVSDCDTWLDPNGPNPFHKKADVRLTKIRVWLVGFKTSASLHYVRIDHLGSELFCAPGNRLYPQYDGGSANRAAGEPPRIYHTGISLPFNYSPEGLQEPDALGRFKPGRLDVDGAQDGDLGFSANVGLGLGNQDCYAAVGPFADWRLVVDDQNTDADWHQCKTIVIDFHGFHQTF